MSETTEARFSVSHRPVKVQRVVVQTTTVDMDYGRVEVCIDGEEYEFSGPDAQMLGASLNTAGGGDMFQRRKHEDDLERKIAVMREATARLKVIARKAITEGTKEGDLARREIFESIDWIMKGCPPQQQKPTIGFEIE